VRGGRILILGGTGEARALAAAVVARGLEVETSLAGITSDPALPPGQVRRGGFGGRQGLLHYLDQAGVAVIADATHPFAATISGHAVAAAAAAGLPYVRLERPPWTPEPGDRWSAVADAGAAAAAVPPGATALVTIGRKELEAFAARPDIKVVARMIEPPGFEPPARWRIVLARPPFPADDELALMRDEGVSVLVTKNAGGKATEGKLVAARALGIPVIMIERPAKPPAATAATVEEMVELVARKREAE
jgi:precorrin-6A/cobalt-precorrin-6A reductase